MKIAFVGKGGSGKTTTSALFARYVAAKGKRVLAIDADINQHLAAALGIGDMPPALGYHLDEIKEHLKADNKRIISVETMLKTTPPGNGSRFFRLDQEDAFFKKYMRSVGNLSLMVTGVFDEADIGLKCYHGKQGAAEIILNHLLDAQDEYVVVDLTAGADSFASGLFLKFDVTFLIVEPTLRGIGVWQQYTQYARHHDIAIWVIGNKIENEADVDFLKHHIGDALLATIDRSGYIKAIEKGVLEPIGQLEEPNQKTLQTMLSTVDSTKQDRADFYQKVLTIHTIRAESEVNEAKKQQYLDQIDPEFDLATVAAV